MDRTDTRKFLADACDLLPRLAGYINATSDRGELIVDAWASGLAEIDLADAVRVITEIATAEAPLPDGFLWEHFPRLVRERVKSLRYAMSREARQAAARNRESTYACGLCLDSGFVRIYHPGFVRSYVLYSSCRQRLADSDPADSAVVWREYMTWRKQAIQCRRRGVGFSLSLIAICTCDAGDRHFESKTLPSVVRYDDALSPIMREQTPREILSWIDRRNTPTEWNPEDWS